MKSDLFSINWRDLGKGFITALITAALASISMAIEAGSLPTLTQLKTAGLAGLVAGIAYLIKNFLTNGTAEAKKTIEAKGGTVIE
jgi:hypothetical protein